MGRENAKPNIPSTLTYHQFSGSHSEAERVENCPMCRGVEHPTQHSCPHQKATKRSLHVPPEDH